MLRRSSWLAPTFTVLAMALAGCATKSELRSQDSDGSTTDATNTSSSTTGDFESTTETTTTSNSTGSETGSDGSGTSSGSTQTDGSSGGSTASGTDTTGAEDCRLVIVEVLYDAEGNDDEFQWLKLFNSCNVAIDLSAYTIGYATSFTDGYSNTKSVTGTIAADGCFVIGGPNSAAANATPDLDFAEDFAPGFEIPAAEEPGLGIALFDVAANQLDGDSIPIDAVIYGANNDSNLIDETGEPAGSPHVGNPPEGGSIRRTGLESTWETAAIPTPNDCPPF
jgi:hypothetical protein